MDNNSVPRIPDFNMLRRIGGGSYGVVWIARSLTGIYRAVKVVDRARFNDARPFLRELDGITRFQQTVGNEPRQLALMHVGRDDEQGIFYYVMELADDVDASTDINPELYVPLTLKALRERRHLLPAAECVRLGIELARALAGLHAAGLIHRDVKPSNIIFVNGVPKLADVGLVSSSDHTLTSLGTPGYAPPEGAGTMEADVYGLGKILYELATGCPTMDFPRLPAEVTTREDTPLLLELNEVLLRACHPDPRERYPSAQAMLDDLLLLQAGKSVKELVRTKHRLRVLARASGIAALIALAALGVLGWKNYRAARQLAAQEAAARQQAERDERLARYSADLHLAQLALNGGDFGVARSALRRQIPVGGEVDVRGLEWRALWSETAGDAERVFGEARSQTWKSGYVSPDGTKAVALSAGGDAVVVDLKTGGQTTVITGAIAVGGFVDSARKVVVCTEARKLRLVDIASGEIGEEQATHGRLLRGVGDGRSVLMFFAGPNGFRLWLWDVIAERELASYEPSPRGPDYYLSTVAVSNDGRYLAAAATWTEGAEERKEIVFWDFQERRELARNHELNRVLSVSFSADSTSVVAAASGETSLAVMDPRSGEIRYRLPTPEGVTTTVAFLPAGSIAAGGRAGGIRVWSRPAAAESRLLRGHEGPLSALSWAMSDSRLVSFSEDGTVRLWDPAGGESRAIRSDMWSGTRGAVAFSPDGKTLAVTDRGGHMAILDSRTLTTKFTVQDAFEPISYLGTTGQIAALSPSNQLLHVNTGTGLVEPKKLLIERSKRISAVTASPGGRFAALAAGEGEVEFWNVETGERLGTGSPHGKKIVWGLAIASDSRLAVSGDHEGGVVVWRLPEATMSTRLPAQGQAVASLSLSPNGDLLAIGRSDGSVLIWSLETQREIKVLRGHSSAVNALVFAGGGSRLLSGAKDGMMIAWETSDFRQLASLMSPRSLGATPRANRGVYQIASASNHEALAVLAQDGVLQIWIPGPAETQAN